MFGFIAVKPQDTSTFLCIYHVTLTNVEGSGIYINTSGYCFFGRFELIDDYHILEKGQKLFGLGLIGNITLCSATHRVLRICT